MGFRFPIELPFGVDSATLICKEGAGSYFNLLYERYRSELLPLTSTLWTKRQQMISRGLGADFGDIESELLYMLVRETKPELVVEISPCHGYSSNYILAALTKNDYGKLLSFEITQETNGKPTENIIIESLIDSVDIGRIEIIIGDATKAEIPACDILFLDSCHEAWFAAWYIENVIPKSRLCFVHDIVVSDKSMLIPKAPWTGIRESYQLLHSLALVNQNFASAAQIELELAPSSRLGLTPRNAKPERSIIFPGHACTAGVLSISEAQHLLFVLREKLLLGDRHGVISGIREISKKASHDAFTRLTSYQLIADLGYRARAIDLTLIDMIQDVESIISAGFDDISTFVAALELGTRLIDDKIVYGAISKADKINSPAVPYFVAHYSEYSLPLNRLAAGAQRRLLRTLALQ